MHVLIHMYRYIFFFFFNLAIKKVETGSEQSNQETIIRFFPDVCINSGPVMVIMLFRSYWERSGPEFRCEHVVVRNLLYDLISRNNLISVQADEADQRRRSGPRRPRLRGSFAPHLHDVDGPVQSGAQRPETRQTKRVNGTEKRMEKKLSDERRRNPTSPARGLSSRRCWPAV